MCQSNCSAEYAAGLFDGEGTVFITYKRGGGGYVLETGITMTDREPLEAVCNTFGGTIFPNDSIGYEKAPNGNRNYWRWKPRKLEMCNFFRAVLPFLRCKHIQIQIALDFLAIKAEGYTRTGKQGSLSDESRSLREGYRLAIKEAKNL